MAMLPPTDCELCQQAERPRLRSLAGGVALVVAAVAAYRADQPSRRMIQAWGSGYAATMRAMLGGAPEPTWYEKHRESYAATGDPAELARMLRHVKELTR